MFEQIIDQFSTSEKRTVLYAKIFTPCFFALLVISLPFGKIAYNGIQKEVITFENGLTYDVWTGRNPQVRIKSGEFTYRSICRNTEERSNHICRNSFDNHHFIGEDVRFLVYKMEDNNTYQGVILSGIFTDKSDNDTYQVNPTNQELNSANKHYNFEVLLVRSWFLVSIIGILTSIIGIIIEFFISD